VEGFSIKTEYFPQDNSIVIVRLSGYVDQSNSHQIEKLISDVLQTNRQKLVFDLSDLIYMSSAGWGIFIGEVKTVRDAGGDIKVAAMSPEVYDVFQVLEFYHILNDFPTVEDAINSFIGNGQDELVDSGKEETEPDDATDIADLLDFSDIEATKKSRSKKEKEFADATEVSASDTNENFDETPIVGTVIKKPAQELRIDITRLPLNEKIKKIVSNFPLLNIVQIRKMLHHEEFGNTKISYFRLYKILKTLNLHNKKLRYRFYRST
jgi:anti-sigma B factor antagonist